MCKLLAVTVFSLCSCTNSGESYSYSIVGYNTSILPLYHIYYILYIPDLSCYCLNSHYYSSTWVEVLVVVVKYNSFIHAFIFSTHHENSCTVQQIEVCSSSAMPQYYGRAAIKQHFVLIRVLRNNNNILPLFNNTEK